VSFALGAFFAGVVLSESDFSHQAAADSLPLQDAFAVLFFVSVGMLLDPSILMRQPLASWIKCNHYGWNRGSAELGRRRDDPSASQRSRRHSQRNHLRYRGLSSILVRDKQEYLAEPPRIQRGHDEIWDVGTIEKAREWVARGDNANHVALINLRYKQTGWAKNECPPEE
jgi:hypothetical protein